MYNYINLIKNNQLLLIGDFLKIIFRENASPRSILKKNILQ